MSCQWQINQQAAISRPDTKGTKLDITATDHIRPIATTAAIP